MSQRAQGTVSRVEWIDPTIIWYLLHCFINYHVFLYLQDLIRKRVDILFTKFIFVKVTTPRFMLLLGVFLKYGKKENKEIANYFAVKYYFT